MANELTESIPQGPSALLVPTQSFPVDLPEKSRVEERKAKTPHLVFGVNTSWAVTGPIKPEARTGPRHLPKANALGGP